MNSVKSAVTGAIVTLIIGGIGYSVSTEAITKNLAANSGMSQEQAVQYVNSINEEDLVGFEYLGANLTKDGADVQRTAAEIDCEHYDYEWETPTLTCTEGRKELYALARDTSALGQAYAKLGTESADENDIKATIQQIDRINADYRLEIVTVVLSRSTINEAITTNLYNKSVLQAALESK